MSGIDTSQFPVERVIWHDAVDFCSKLSEQEGVEYRLPTEAEWEYACRAGTTTAYLQLWRAMFPGLASMHGTSDNSKNTTHTVGELKPNAWDLYDMHGNVFEWCQDWHGPYESLQVVSDPTGAAQGEYRVLRGGAFNLQPRPPPSVLPTATTTGRSSVTPVFGFRLARTYPLSP